MINRIIDRLKHDHAGFSLMEVMIAAGMLGVVSLGVLSINSLGIKGGTNNLLTFQADAIRKKLASHVNNDQAWQRTVADTANTSLTCIRDTTDCRGATGRFRIRDASNNLVYDPLVTTSGFTGNGENCNAFDSNPSGGSDACPFRQEYTWTAVCPPTGSCLNPQVSLSGSMIFRPAPTNKFRKFAFNPAAYGLNMVRNANPTAQGNGNGYFLARWFDNKTLGTSQVFESSTGQLGLGTTSPVAKIDLNGAAWSNFRINDGSQVAGKYLMSNADGAGSWNTVDWVPNAHHATNADNATNATYATYVNNDATNMKFHWSGQGGQPTWVWGSNDPNNAYVWNPSNFSVNYANSAGSAGSAGYAANAGNANYANTAGSVGSANYATTALQLKVFNTSANWATIGYMGSGRDFALFVDGTFVKSFVINHPTDPARYLVHGTLEGPEGGVYYRGRATLVKGHARVELPSYFEALTRKDNRTVHLTAVGGFDRLAVKTHPAGEVHDGYFEVISENEQSAQSFFWEVIAVRGDVAPLVVEPLKAEYEVHGVGPYTYAKKKTGPHGRGDALERNITSHGSEIEELREALCELNPRAKACQAK